MFENYCKIQGLNVNLSKTKKVILSKRKSRIHHDFKSFEKSIDVQDFYTHFIIGVVFNYNCSFDMAMQTYAENYEIFVYL